MMGSFSPSYAKCADAKRLYDQGLMTPHRAEHGRKRYVAGHVAIRERIAAILTISGATRA